MPRNRKKQTPTEPVEASIDERGMWSCGRCGQAFPFIFNTRIAEHVLARDADGFETRRLAPGFEMRVHYGYAEAWLEVMSIVAWGWKFDGTVWRPTAENRRRWLQASEVVKHPDGYTERQVAEAKAGIKRGSFPRSNSNPSNEPSHTNDVGQRFTLPTQIECIKCGRLNRVVQDL
jgi:hypothetical protein